MTRQLSTGLDALPEARPRRGDVLGGKYRIESEVGSGGMGVVYEVTHVVMTERRFAVKWLLPVQDGGESARRFVREARIAGRIRHPHVVDVYDINMDPDGCFMVMELLEGESLDARLRREGSVGVTDACEILHACLSGVAAAHAVGVIHRDLKPANIFLCETSEPGRCHPKVLDFGISRTLPVSGETTESTETRKGTLIGTPAYMAPEQLRGAACDVRTDVYALGVTLYEMLSGQRAYDAPTYADLIVRVVSGDAAPLEEVVPQLPQELCDSVMRAMHRDPKQRFASVAELAEQLEPYVVPSEPSTRLALRGLPPSAATRPRRTPLRKHLVLTAAALGLALTGMLWLRAPQVGEQHQVLPAPRTDHAAKTMSSESKLSPATDPTAKRASDGEPNPALESVRAAAETNQASLPTSVADAAPNEASSVAQKRAGARATPRTLDDSKRKPAKHELTPSPLTSSAPTSIPHPVQTPRPGASERKPKPQPPLTEF